MSKPIVVIWQNGVNLFQDNTGISILYTLMSDGTIVSAVFLFPEQADNSPNKSNWINLFFML